MKRISQRNSRDEIALLCEVLATQHELCFARNDGGNIEPVPSEAGPDLDGIEQGIANDEVRGRQSCGDTSFSGMRILLVIFCARA